MKKRTFLIILYTLLTLVSFLLPKQVSANQQIETYRIMVEDREMSSSAGYNLARVNALDTDFEDERIKRLRSYLIYKNSPLVAYSHYLVKKADEYDIPWTLVASISGVESNFCRVIPRNSFNCWGWNNGKSNLGSYENAIEIVSKTLRNKYYNYGLTTPETIAPKYAPPSSGKWARNVWFFTNQISNFPLEEKPILPINI